MRQSTNNRRRVQNVRQNDSPAAPSAFAPSDFSVFIEDFVKKHKDSDAALMFKTSKPKDMKNAAHLYCSILGLNTEKLMAMADRCPDFLDFKKTGGFVNHLLSLGVSKEELVSTLENAPHLCRVKPRKKLIKYFTTLGLEEKDWLQLICKYDQIVALKKSDIKTRVKFLCDQELHKEEIGSLLLRAPKILSCSLEHLQAITNNFKQHMKVKRIARLIRKCPKILVDGKEKRMNYFKTLGLKEENWVKFISRSYQIVTRKISRIKMTVKFLRDQKIPKEKIGKLLFRTPIILSLSQSKLQEKVNVLNRHLEVQEIGHLICSWPKILKLSAWNLKTKWEELEQMGYSKKDALDYPLYFGASLKCKIRPRFEVAGEKNPTLQDLIKPTEAEFVAKYGEY